MQQDQVVKVPDVGDIIDIQVIEILVAPGDQLDIEAPLLTLESDKATMDVPSPIAGTVTEVLVAVGDSVSTDTPIVRIHGPEQSTGRTDSVEQFDLSVKSLKNTLYLLDDDIEFFPGHGKGGETLKDFRNQFDSFLSKTYKEGLYGVVWWVDGYEEEW